MSIVNLYAGETSAWMAVDTEGRTPEGCVYNCQKMIPLIHLNAVMAGRGKAVFLPMAYSYAAWSCLEFDDLAVEMPELCRKAFQDVSRANLAGGAAAHADIANQAILLLGWSQWRQSFVAVEYLQTSESDGFAAREVGPAYFSPWVEGMQAPAFADPFDRDAIRRLADMQVRLIKERAPGAAGGGRFILADLSMDRMQIEVIHDLRARHCS